MAGPASMMVTVSRGPASPATGSRGPTAEGWVGAGRAPVGPRGRAMAGRAGGGGWGGTVGGGWGAGGGGAGAGRREGVTAGWAESGGSGDDPVSGGQFEVAGRDGRASEPAGSAEPRAGEEVEVAGFAPGGGEEGEFVRGAPGAGPGVEHA